MNERIKSFIENLPWWWVLIAISPIIIFIFIISKDSFDRINAPKTESVRLIQDVVVIIGVDGFEYHITGENLTPEGCTLVPQTKNLTNSSINYIMCGGKTVGTVQCVVDCTLVSNKIKRIETLSSP